jgi:hypothetical protein
MRYMLNVEVKLIEMDEPDVPEEPLQVDTAGLNDDPMVAFKSIGAQALKLMKPPVGGFGMPFTLPAGLDYRKSVSISVPNFVGIVEVLGKYETLTRELQLHSV